MKCAVLNFDEGTVEFFSFSEYEDIEKVLRKKGYHSSNIEYMCVENLAVKVI